ncbi:MAG: FUSC family protein [Phycisphaerales bacterium]
MAFDSPRNPPSPSAAQIAHTLFSRPKPWKLNLVLAASYSLQAIVASLILSIGYWFTDALAVTWAIISAVIAIQPGLQQSLTASLTRIVANIVGAIVGLGLGLVIGIGPWQVLIGIVVVVVICQFFRLEDGLRIACIAVVIVLSMNLGSTVIHSAVERSITVIAGCVVGTMVQFGAEALSRKLGVHDLLFAPAPVSADQIVQQAHAAN